MVVFFDVDGTIVDETTQIIPASTVRAVQALARKGHLAVVNTGRPYGHLDPRVRAMAFGGWVCGCGMEIFLNGKWLLRRMPEQALCRYVVDSVRECGMSVLYEDRDALYRDGSFSRGPVEQLEEARLRKKGVPVREISEFAQPRFMKFVTHDLPGCRREEFLRRMEPHFTCIDRGNTMVEYVLKGSSKAEGMAGLLRYLHVPREQTYAIGDSTNDLPMFGLAAHTACMGGGMAELKAQAEFITAEVMDDGIEQALKHFGLIGNPPL